MSIERADDASVELVGRTIVTALPLEPQARQRLAELTQARVIDVREPAELVDVVLTPSCSPQLIGALKRKYEGARVIVVELDDWEFGVELAGPVKRLVRGGADAYLLADSIDELASKIGGAATASAAAPTPDELTSSATVDELIAAFLRESVEYSTRLRPTDG